MPVLKLLLLGPPQLERDGQVLDIGRRKAMALLAYLAVTGQSHSRDSLATLFWPEADQSHARTALRRVLSDMNKWLGEAQLESEGDLVALPAGAGLWVDVNAFHALLADYQAQRAEQPCQGCIPILTEAVSLYRDDFLAGFTLPDCPDFDEWQFFLTEQLRQELAGALAELVQHHTAEAAFEIALVYSRRWLALDPLSEAPQRALMELYALTGQRNAALRQYQEYVRILADELDVPPPDEITALYERIRRGEVAPQGGKGAREQGSRGAREQGDREEAGSRDKSQLPITNSQLPLVEDELRPVTVLAAGLSDISEPTWEIQPEDAAESIEIIARIMAEVGARYHAQLDRVGADGLQLLFGLPHLHEDDPQRAVQAGLEIQQAAAENGLQVSIGLSSGRIYFNPSGAANRWPVRAIGPVVNLATRLQYVAEAGQVLASQTTFQQARRAFQFQPVTVHFGGRTEPAIAYELVGPPDHPEPTPGLEGMGAELIGRDEELKQLSRSVEQVRQGQGQVVTIIGEAGVGKSRLVTELKQLTQSNPALAIASSRPDQAGSKSKIQNHLSGLFPEKSKFLWLEGRCLEFRKATSYWPFIDLLQNYLAVHSDDDQDRANCLSSVLEEMARRGDLSTGRAGEMTALLGNLLSLPLSEPQAELIKNAGREQLRHQTFMAIYDFFVALARQQPLGLIFEDLHWADDLSLEVMLLLLEALAANSLLLLYLYRPEQHHQSQRLGRLAAQRYPERHTELRLRELATLQSRRLVDALLGQDDSLTKIKTLILERSRGNPLFIEEAIRALIDGGFIRQQDGRWQSQAEIESISVPETVQAIILSRIDHLEPNLKQLLHHAAVMGYLFRPQLIAQTLPPDFELDQALLALEELALVYPERVVPEVEYVFKHVLTQESIYQTLSRRRRNELHRQLAEAIERLYSDDIKAYYEQLAYHYDQTEVVEKAVEYLIKAGQKSCAAFFTDEAIRYLQKALQRLDEWAGQRPDQASSQMQWRLQALDSLGSVMHGTGRDQEAERYLRQAINIGREAGLPAKKMVRLYHWLCEALHWLGRHAEQVSLAETGLTLLNEAEMESVEAVLMNQAMAIGHYNLGNSELYQRLTERTAQFIRRLPYSEELRPAYLHIIIHFRLKKDFDQALAWIKHLEQLAGRHYDPRAMAAAHEHRWGLSFERGLLYDPDLHFSRILDLYSKVGDNLRLLGTLGTMVWTSLMQGDLAEAARCASRELETAQRLALDAFLAESLLNTGTVRLVQGDWPEAAEAIEQAIKLASSGKSAWVEWAATYCLGRLHLAQGNKGAALNQFQTALAHFEHHPRQEWRFQWWPLLVCILSGIEAAYDQPEEFITFCNTLDPDKQRQIAASLLDQWALEPADPLSLASSQFEERFDVALADGWSWIDPFSDCSLRLQDGLEIHAANGRDLWHANRSAPRLLRPVSGNFVIQTAGAPSGAAEAQAGQPVIGGLLLWKDTANFLRLVWGNRGPTDLSFEGCLDHRDVIIGRGCLAGLEALFQEQRRVWLRLERHGEQVRALCSADSEQWFSVGKIDFPATDPVDVGLHAVGWIDRTIYPGAFPDGAAIRFESFQIWPL